MTTNSLNLPAKPIANLSKPIEIDRVLEEIEKNPDNAFVYLSKLPTNKTYSAQNYLHMLRKKTSSDNSANPSFSPAQTVNSLRSSDDINKMAKDPSDPLTPFIAANWQNIGTLFENHPNLAAHMTPERWRKLGIMPSRIFFILNRPEAIDTIAQLSVDLVMSLIEAQVQKTKALPKESFRCLVGHMKLAQYISFREKYPDYDYNDQTFSHCTKLDIKNYFLKNGFMPIRSLPTEFQLPLEFTKEDLHTFKSILTKKARITAEEADDLISMTLHADASTGVTATRIRSFIIIRALFIATFTVLLLTAACLATLNIIPNIIIAAVAIAAGAFLIPTQSAVQYYTHKAACERRRQEETAAKHSSIKLPQKIQLIKTPFCAVATNETPSSVAIPSIDSATTSRTSLSESKFTN